jgi:LPS export ABC transporter protein LptC
MSIDDCRLTIALRLTVLACVAVLLPGCPEKEVEYAAVRLPDQVAEDFRLDETSSGERLFTLESERAEVYEDSQVVQVTGVKVTFYDNAGGVYSVLTAETGTIQRLSEDLVARGSVVVRTADSTVLQTDSLVWSNGDRRVHTDAPVAIATPKGEVSGVGLESDAGLQRIDMKSEVRGTSQYEFESGK